MEIFKAHRQWSSRPVDERFDTIQKLHNACKSYASKAQEAMVPWKELRAVAKGDDVEIVGREKKAAAISHWAFGQLCGFAGAPAAYLRGLSAKLATENLNHGLAKREGTAALMFHKVSSMLLRAVTSEVYSRIWNWEISERLLELEQMGWEPAMPDFNKSADDFAACYASDHDMFVFIRNKDAMIKEPGNKGGLQRGIIVENSEVGASALKMTRFLYRGMCGNHIIWDTSKVVEISVKHIGATVKERFLDYTAELKAYADTSASEEEAVIIAAKRVKLGKSKADVLDYLFGKRLGVSKKVLEASVDAVQPEEDGDPFTVWGVVNGMTRYSQTIPYADQRTDVDRAAGKVMLLAT